MPMWCRIYVSDDDISFWEENNVSPAVIIDSIRDVLRVFINGQLTGDTSLSLPLYIPLSPFVFSFVLLDLCFGCIFIFSILHFGFSSHIQT